MKDALSYVRAHELLEYDPGTGQFTWRVYRNSQARAGQPAGSLCPLGYVVLRVDKVLYQAHRVAWLMHYGAFPTQHLDHINHDRADNRINNLREACRQANAKNRSKSKNNTSGINGVYLVPGGKWIARISVGRKLINLGTFPSAEEAAVARAAADQQHNYHPNHGE